jgi:PAS domain S-box-containing protein
MAIELRDHRSWSLASRSALAFAIVAVPLCVRLLLLPIEYGLAFLTFYPSVTLCFLYCGNGPAAVMTVLSAITAYYIFLPPAMSFVATWNGLIATAFFLLSSTLIGWVVHNLRACQTTLAKSHDLMRVTLACIGDAVLTTDPQGRVVSLNRAAERLTGWRESEARGRPATEVFRASQGGTGAADLARQCLEADAATLANEPMTLMARTQSKLLIECSVSPLRDDGRAAFGAVIAFRDVSEKRRLHEDMTRRERQHAEALAVRLEALFGSSADMMVIAHAMPDGGFVHEAVNPAWERNTGIAALAAVGLDPRGCLPEPLAETMLAGFAACVAARRASFMRFETAADGARVWDASVTPVFGDRGVINRLILVARDVTERLQMEASMRQMQRLEAVAQITAGVAHDFNNLLQAILGPLELLQDQPGLDADGHECLALATGAAQRGATLVHRLLAFSRKQPLAPGLLAPGELLNGLQGLLVSTMVGRIRCETKVQDAVWSVWADGTQLENCLFNLALNARDAMPNGGTLTLSVSNTAMAAARAEGLPAGDYVCFTVADDGTGMTAEVLGRATEPFFTTRPVGKGTGLGLSMVQGFARQSGGDIHIESAPGHGTTVSMWLPAVVEVAASAAKGHAGPRAAIGDRGKILVVDDEAAVRRVLLMFLTKAGFTATALESGETALEQLRAGVACDLLITDQSMPGMTGTELIDQVARVRPALRTTLMTGYDRVSGLDRLPVSVAVLRKPFEQAAFIKHVEAVLAGAGGMAMAGDEAAGVPR